MLSADELRANTEGHPRPARAPSWTSGAATPRLGRSSSTTPTGWATSAVLDFLRDVGKHFTVNQMVAKDSVRSRLSVPDRSISYTEFSYMLLQATDFLHLFDDFGCRLQVGGSDQWGNITMGVDLVRRVRHEEVWGLTTPLVVKADGTKFGKTEAGTVWLDPARTSPYQLYQFFLRTEDAVVGRLPPLLHLPVHEAIIELDEATASRPGSARGPARAGPAGLHAGARGGEHGQGRAHRRRPVRRGPGISSTRSRSSMCSPMRPRPPWRASGSTGRAPRWSTCSSTPAWPASKSDARAARRAGRGLRQRPEGRRRRAGDRAVGPALRPLRRPAPRQEGLPPGELYLRFPPTG